VLALLHRPIAYTFGAPVVMVAGAATTIVAPRILNPASFAQFVLLASIVQYAGEFDLGLGRLIDRKLSRRNVGPELLRPFIVARLWLASVLLILLLIAVPFTSVLTGVAALAGVGMMLCNGPLAFFRAQSKLAAFTTSALAIQLGLSLPRLTGLLLGGVAGCMVALAVWYCSIAAILTTPLLGLLRRPAAPTGFLLVFAASAPLFVFNSSWLLLLLANRWFAWLLCNPEETGLFVFGANLVGIGAGMISTIAQAYYPRHLAASRPAELFGELWRLVTLAMIGVLLGCVICGLGFGRVFPRFVGAEACTAALLITGVPLSLCAWLMPLIIARSRRPLRDTTTIFPACLVTLFVCMLKGQAVGIEGLAWGCLPATLGLLGWLLGFAARDGLMTIRAATLLWFMSMGGCVTCGGIWLLIFHAVPS
jgi:hypothetical protein